MANIDNIIQEINTNLPDNNTQATTAKKLRDTLVNTVYNTTEEYDITVNTSNTKYANLTAALGTNGVNVPANIRKPGMTVRFVNSVTSKYEQYRYLVASITDAVFVNTNNWQGIDDEPTTGSNNLIKSGGVENYCKPIVGCLLETNIPSISRKVQYPFITLGKGLYKMTVTPNNESDTLAANIYHQSGTLIGTFTNESNVVRFEITDEVETINYYRGGADTVNNNSTILIQNIAADGNNTLIGKFYVDGVNGSDTNNGETKSTAFKTFAKIIEGVGRFLDTDIGSVTLIATLVAATTGLIAKKQIENQIVDKDTYEKYLADQSIYGDITDEDIELYPEEVRDLIDIRTKEKDL